MRHDIQFLRGIAVLSVVFYHAGFWPISNGYLGVDIFFVISGFLITKIILRQLETEQFSFSAFYLRRAKRLLPALYSTLIITTLLAYIFLTPGQWNDYLSQFFGAISFTANMVLPQQVGYFEDAAETKLLLHIWSLSLEEQYYFFLPLFLFLVPTRKRGFMLGIATVLSFSLCLYLLSTSYVYWRFPTTDSAGWAFYLFPTRAWELLAGSLSAWYMLKHPDTSIPRTFKFVSVMGLAVIICVSVDNVHPRGNALLAVLFTSVLILGKDNWLPSNLGTKAIEIVGDWSYSLYLIHWPIFAFSQIAFLGKVPVQVTVLLTCISFILAYFQYKFVEQKLRHGFKSSKYSAYKFLIGSTVILLLLPVPVMVLGSIQENAPNQKNYDELRKANYGLDQSCNRPFNGTVVSLCQTSNEPNIAIWGDSYAMHLVPGLRKNPITNSSIIQLTMSFCGPIVDLAAITTKYNKEWAHSCVEHNRRVLDEIVSSTSIEIVILSSPFYQYFEEKNQSFLYEKSVVARNSDLAIAQLSETVRLLQKAGKVPIIVSPPPKSGFNVGDCLERQSLGLVFFGRSNCNIPFKEYRDYEHEVITALTEVRQKTGVKIVWLESLLCDGQTCQTSMGDVALYRDGGHFSIAGSEVLISELQILDNN